ncbi:GtrA family protein [Allohahella marinimesophila]|uniref:GtrA family protein n=1 Tax=Allohahella marinimesophila TaxID=1054972 RepID=UPI003CD0A0C1
MLGYFLLSLYIDYNVAKGISFCLGSIVAYVLNNIWTFKVTKFTHVNVMKFSLLYITTFLFNVAINALVFLAFEIKFLAFLFATGVSAVLNYVGLKYWVFKK